MGGLYYFPEKIEQLVRERIDAEGPARPKTLAAAAMRLSDLFNGLAPWRPDYARDPQLRRAYLAYFLPVNLPKLELPLSLWHAPRPDAWAGKPLRCLDLGCGPGTALLAVADFVARLPPERRPSRLEFVGVDESFESLRDAADLLMGFADAAGLPPLRFESLRSDLGGPQAVLPQAAEGGRFDLVIAANLLCELDRPSDDDDASPQSSLGYDLLAAAQREVLAADGALIVIEPALRNTARALHRLRDRLLDEGPLRAHAPCLHQAHCPALVRDRDWCIAELRWQPPTIVRQIEVHLPLRKDALKFAYLLLSAVEATPAPAGRWRVVSEALPSKGQARAHLCGDGTWRVISQLTRSVKAGASDLAGVRRGDVVDISEMEERGDTHRIVDFETVHRSGEALP